ncbi:Chordin [Sarcoptes scabiei]|uniref:Chordin n=2 Tax=Sarcoptes scabiei TaxID=52283 RepID=A0A834VDW2_SARSC|nr:Chordin [Sarcoptes scabiei]
MEEIIASQKIEESLMMKNARKKFSAILAESQSIESSKNESFTDLILRNDRKTGRAFFHVNKQRLAFIVKIKSRQTPTFVRFQDLDGSIIEEYVILGNRTKVNGEYKIFGHWNKVPKPYRTMLRKGHLQISVSFNRDINVRSSLIGIIRKNQKPSIDRSSEESFYYDLLESQSEKNSAFEEMLNTTSFVSYQNSNSLDRKALMDQSSNQPNINSIDSNLKCYYEAQIYEEGAQWKNQNDDCEMCFCQRGRVKCESEICLKLKCREKIRIPGQCCPICKNKLNAQALHRNQSCYFEGDKKYHLIGSRWHPYIPPFGFDRCTVCTCSEGSKIKCKRNECPALPCAERDSYRENPMDCCKKCRGQTRSMMSFDPETMNDQASNDDNIEQTLMNGNCRFRGRIYSNGDEWNPSIDPYGEINCIRCTCKDGLHKCSRLECKPQPPDCQKIIKKGQCCPVCAGTDQSSENDKENFHRYRSGGRRISDSKNRF